MNPEFKWINLLLSKAGALAKGVGDDAFVFGKYLMAADMSVEGTHFRLDWSSPGQAVEKCLLSNFSDINAMGGKAEAILFSVCMNKKWSKKIRDEIASSVAKVCKKHDVKILGGDTTGGDIGVFSVAVFGRSKGKILLRSAAKSGDDVWVSGFPGKSSAGLELLMRGGKFNRQEQELVNLHKVPQPPLGLGEMLAKIKGMGACIDLSDSLAESLHHISMQSKVQIQLEKDMPLNGSEDYELLFTAKKSAREKILRLAKKVALQRIGTVKKGQGVFFDGKRVEAIGWQHFLTES
jgi:thiamine-monophosphate kinase